MDFLNLCLFSGAVLVTAQPLLKAIEVLSETVCVYSTYNKRFRTVVVEVVDAAQLETRRKTRQDHTAHTTHTSDELVITDVATKMLLAARYVY
jgi:hypothetical protein